MAKESSKYARVQRVPSTWPILHLESEIPTVNSLVVSGLVERRISLRLEDLEVLGERNFEVPIHCVWGWSQPAVSWGGVELARVLDLAVPRGNFVTVRSASGRYSSCLPVEDAARGILAWEKNGRHLLPEEGGPLRYVAPPNYWAYKGVKWASAIVVLDRFVPGFWESRVADPVGLIPDDVKLP